MDTSKELIRTLQKHKHALTTVKGWDKYAKEHNLPPSVSLIYAFGSWNAVKQALGLPAQKNKYSIQELEEIAEQHKEHITGKLAWDEYSKKNHLPSSSTFIKVFGSWNQFKKHIGVQQEKKKRSIYDKEIIVQILKEHAEHYINRTHWDEYAKEHKLPTYKTIRNYLTYDELATLVNKKGFSKEELIKIAIQHQQYFFPLSMKKWDRYAKENGLPSSFIYFKSFGSWKRAKGEVTKLGKM